MTGPRQRTRDECKQLDAYLREHRPGFLAGVLYAFDHQEEYKKDRSPEQARDCGTALRHNLFVPHSRHSARLQWLAGGGWPAAALLNNPFQSEDESDGVEDDEEEEGNPFVEDQAEEDRSPTLGQALRRSIASWRRLPH